MDKNKKSLGSIWRVPDELWNKLKLILDEHEPPKLTGRKRIDARAALDAIIFWLRSGCQWNQLPTEFPDDSSVHRTFQRWEKNGVLDRIWAALVHLAVQERVAASTQNQAFSALLFLYREVLRQELDESIDAVRAKQPRQLPTVLTKDEVRSVIQRLSGVPLNEGLNLRVKDLDFAQHQIIVPSSEMSSCVEQRSRSHEGENEDDESMTALC